MNTTQISTNLQKTIESIAKSQIKTPRIPIGIYIQEGENLYQWCREDKEKLTGAGLNWNLVEELPDRCEALQQAQGTWISERKKKKEAEKIWAERSVEAYQLRDELLHTLRYAYRKTPDLLVKISFVSKGDGHADMLQDLNDLAILGADHPGPLKAINFDFSKLELAARMSDELSDLLGRANAEILQREEAKIKRDKAYTYLKALVDEIRECGKYVFWNKPERVRGYKSEYLRRFNLKRNKNSHNR